MALGKIGALDILLRLFDQVHIPTSVHREVIIEGEKQGYIDARMVAIAVRQERIIVEDVSLSDLPFGIDSLNLDAGEREVIYLSTQQPGSLVLLDDLKAREEAKRLGLTVKGTLGVFTQAYRENLISFAEVSAFMETIIAHDAIWISADLCREVLKRIETEQQLK